jgi:N5-(cytidine 5'-diphosphoramidyl)-L-glutamine hydrolase
VLIAITQRVVQVPSRNERRDTLDQAWLPFAVACGLELLLIPNCHPDPAGYLRRLRVRGLILSGGGNISARLATRRTGSPLIPNTQADLAPERDATESALLRASLDEDWPVLGVCRGMQVLNVFHGGEIVEVRGHAGTRHALSTRANAGYRFDSEVNSFHDLAIPSGGVASNFQVLADSNGLPEAMIDRLHSHLGIMWHPERNAPFSENDIDLFRRFFRGDNDEHSSTSATPLQ